METNTPNQENGQQNKVNFNPNVLKTAILNKFSTLAAYADHMGWTRQYIYHILSGQYEPSNNLKARIAQSLGIDSRNVWPEPGKGVENGN